MKALSLRWISFSVFIALLVTVLAPTSLGGSADYVIVDGRSMEPTYRDGDLVITRVAEEYQPGDVIAYDAPLDVPFPVIHRIVERADGGFVTRGDNRDRNDGWIAPDDAIHGVAWLHLPRGGTLIEFLRRPSTILAVLAGWLVFGYLDRREAVTDERKETDAALVADSDRSTTTTTARSRRAELTSARREKRHFIAFVIGGALIGLSGAVFAANASTLRVDGGVLQLFEPVLPSFPEPGSRVNTEANVPSSSELPAPHGDSPNRSDGDDDGHGAEPGGIGDDGQEPASDSGDHSVGDREESDSSEAHLMGDASTGTDSGEAHHTEADREVKDPESPEADPSRDRDAEESSQASGSS